MSGKEKNFHPRYASRFTEYVRMRYISLYSGCAGGDLGCQHLSDWECMGYVEWDKYCCRVLEQRIKDKFLSDAPIFCGDIRRWIELGYAAAYSGMVDVITAGFPCQPFSVAGKQRGKDDERNMWPATRDCVRIIRPRYCLFENVPGLLNSGYFGTIVNDLAESGYCVRWKILSAAEVGAPHKRDRLWIVAHASSQGLEKRQGATGERAQPATTRSGWWATEPAVGRVANGVAHRVDRLKAIGNGQVPAVVAEAWRILSE